MTVQTWYRVDKGTLVIEPMAVIGESNLIVRVPGSDYSKAASFRRKDTARHRLFRDLAEARRYVEGRLQKRIELARTNLSRMEARLEQLKELEPPVLRTNVGRDTIQPTSGVSVP